MDFNKLCLRNIVFVLKCAWKGKFRTNMERSASV
jgi:hypothetical protein